ncbi:ribosome small subunit-dependent GTPase A [Chryseolinea sp. T2]|uniref:ribosome small subunit-dependent GTPase A n=1 Tax=Chryseolinea sp. T2 TaxID=3129255 RepID=UPI0030788BC6
MKGIVLRSTGSFYTVLGEDHIRYNCRVRGKIRLEGIKETNPVAVGDQVLFDTEQDVGSIMEILPRKNHMLRQSVKKTGHAHVLAANIDQVLVVATMALPRTSTGFIDRVLVSAEAFGIPQILLLNKRDVMDEQDRAVAEEIQSLYSSIGVEVVIVSALHDDLNIVKDLLKGRTTLIAGHSGVGKSTLLNSIAPEIGQATSDISDFTAKGVHTTTFAETFEIGEKTFIIDTPGVKEWGLVDMNAQEISDYFPDMRTVRLDCKFQSRCLHINEPGCAVKTAVAEGKIAQSRYDNYVRMASGEDNRK